ncbi:MAG TPA: alpha/beta fold hydrolase [Xanthomonadales bacterium]|nr:alpha/beta fold hydrolase [Xanthomonadales bacterium]
MIKNLAALLLLVPTLLGADDRYFDSGGVSIRYLVAGSGPTVILIHGFSGSAENWVDHGIFDTLAQGDQVIAPDPRVHGLSEHADILMGVISVLFSQEPSRVISDLDVRIFHRHTSLDARRTSSQLLSRSATA